MLNEAKVDFLLKKSPMGEQHDVKAVHASTGLARTASIRFTAFLCVLLQLGHAGFAFPDAVWLRRMG
jgi:hypothetical protein